MARNVYLQQWDSQEPREIFSHTGKSWPTV